MHNFSYVFKKEAAPYKEELIEHLSYTDSFKDPLKAERIVQRINQLTEDMEMISKNRRV